ncbi:ALF repeat-containing protein [Streptomyces wuyuanensis]|uniref:ALF repeat-containing protein n=1 Tax=Streptomyces wuyuanensis TaxID=1196353 RepID=UPI0037FFEE6C
MAKAHKIFDLTRNTEAEDLKTRTAEAIEHAKDLKIADGGHKAEKARQAKEAKDLDAEAVRLAAEAAAPGADSKQIAQKGRKLAVIAMKTRGRWSRTAAEVALAGSDDVISEYIRTGWKAPGEQDERAHVKYLAEEAQSASVRAAAEAALKGDPRQIRTFLETGRHDVAANDYRVYVSQIVSRGQRGVKDAAVAGP